MLAMWEWNYTVADGRRSGWCWSHVLEARLILKMLWHTMLHWHLVIGWFLHIVLVLII